VAEAVRREPVSEPNSLLAAIYQGSTASLARSAPMSLEIAYSLQWLTGEFPTKKISERWKLDQGTDFAEQRIHSSDQATVDPVLTQR